MTNLMKIAIGAGITAAGIAITAHFVEKMEEKEENVEGSKVVVLKDFKEDGTPVIEKAKEDKSVLKRIKTFVKKKFIKALTFVALHMEQIEAIGAVLGLAGTVISISGAIRDFAKGNDVNKKLDAIMKKIEDDERAINHNQQVFGTALDHICEAVKVDQDTLKAALNEVDKRYPV